MAKQSTKAKATIQYRQLKTFGLPDGAVLKDMLVNGLTNKGWMTSAKTRIIDLDQDESVVILNKIINPSEVRGSIFCGQLIQLQSGTDVHAIAQSLDDDAPEYVLQSLNLGERTRVLKGALYFVVAGNHVAMIEGQQVRGRTLERYLTALMQRADELEQGQVIILNSKFMTGGGKELQQSDEVTISASPNKRGGERHDRSNQKRSASGPAAITATEAATEREHEQATVFDILRKLGWDEKAIDSLSAEVPDDGWVEGFFKVFIKQRAKRKPISRATINEALRNIDPADLGLKGDGSERGGVVKLSVSRDVKLVGSLIDPFDAIDQITQALRDWAGAGKIDWTFGA